MDRPAILIIEDDPTMLRGLKDNFEAEGCRVVTARTGPDGLDAVLRSPPDLLLLDIMLPGMNGYAICSSLRKRGFQFPIIMLTARGQEDDVIRGLEQGADDYVTKPFSIRELLARSKAFLRRSQLRDSAVLRFADYVLDLTSYKLLRNSVPVALTSKEFRLLEFLARRPGRALTRDQILDGVWGNDIMVNDRSVDRCVTTLRSKIEPDPHHPRLIKTIRDIGYRFEVG